MSKKVDENSFWLWEDVPLSLEGVFQYRGSSINLPHLHLDPNKLYNVYRPKEELEKAAPTFEALPFFEKHTSVGDSPIFDKKYDEKPAQGVVFKTKFLINKLLGSVKVFSEELKRKIEEGLKGLSLGYSCDYEYKKGVWNGIPYDFVQKNLVGNHLALVPRGRMGSSVALDQNDMTEGHSFAMDSVEFETSNITQQGENMAKGKDEKEAKSEAKDEFVSVEKLYEKFPESREWIDANKYKRSTDESETEVKKDKDSKVGFVPKTKDGSEEKEDDKSKGKGEDEEKEDKKEVKDESEGKKPEEKEAGKDEDESKKDDKEGKEDKAKSQAADEAEIAARVLSQFKANLKATKELAAKAKPVFGGSIAYDEYDDPNALAAEICKKAKLPSDNAVVRAESYLDGVAKTSATYTFATDSAEDGNAKTASFLSSLNK